MRTMNIVREVSLFVSSPSGDEPQGLRNYFLVTGFWEVEAPFNLCDTWPGACGPLHKFIETLRRREFAIKKIIVKNIPVELLVLGSARFILQESLKAA